jgi:predicted transposase YdaD
LILLGYLQPGQPAEIELLPREIDVSTLLPDQPYRVVIGRDPWIVHVEAQTAYDSRIPKRMAEYGARLWMKHQLPVRSYVLMLTRRGLPKDPPEEAQIDAGCIQISVRYELVLVWQIDAQEMLSLNRESLLPFVPLMRGGQAEIEAGAARLGGIADERKQRELSLHFLVVGGLRYNREDLLDLIGRKGMIPLDQLKESSFYQFIVEEGLEEGRKKGLEEGREEGLKEGRNEGLKEGRNEGLKEGRNEGLKEGRNEGLKEGRAQGVAETLNKLVAKRFPNLNVTAEIEDIHDVSALQDLCLAVADLPDPEALRARLAQVIKSTS